MIRFRHLRLRSAEEVRAEVHAEIASLYGVHPDTVALARERWSLDCAAHEPDGRYTFSQYLVWLALRSIEEGSS